MLGLDVPLLLERLSAPSPYRTVGKVRSAKGLVLSCHLPAAVGDQCEVLVAGRRPLAGEIIGFSESQASLLLYEAADDVHPGMAVVNHAPGVKIPLARGLLRR